ncbi:unnamed protein product [Toxocara canis]|nr:unnamed protein product [Toxocara canis]
MDVYSNEIPSEAASVEHIELEIRKINDKLRWIDFLLSRFQSELEYLKGGVNYQVVDESYDAASGDEGEYVYTIDGSMLGSGDNSDRSVNGLYDRFTQLKATVETIVNSVYKTNTSDSSDGDGRMMNRADENDLMKRVHQLETRNERDNELRFHDKKLQDERITVIERQLNKTNALVDKWMLVSDAMKLSHMRIFTALTEQMAQYNSLQSKVVKLELKVAYLQVELMNATRHGALSSASCDATEIAIRFRIDVDEIRKAFEIQRQKVDMLIKEVERKADVHSLKDIRAIAVTANEKIEKIDTDLRNVIEKLNESTNSISNLESSLPKACSESVSTYGINKDYLLIKPSDKLRSHMVRCDGRWTVIQQRTDGETLFNRTFEEYRWPFGEASQDHWIGNEYIHALTEPAGCSIRFETWDLFGDYRIAIYRNFSTSDFASFYRLNISGYDQDRSNLTDAMSFHNGRRFSSLDRDEDSSSTHCARYYAAGWWFANCAKSNLNGNFHLGILWFDMHSGDWIHLRRTRISICTNADDNYMSEYSRPTRAVNVL